MPRVGGPFVLALAIVAAASAACSSSGSGSSRPACLGVTSDAVARATGVRPASAETLHPVHGSGVACGTAFVDPAGQLVVEVRQLDGAHALAEFRAATAGDIAAAQFRAVPSLGRDAFVASRAAGFVVAGTTVALRTGFDSSGNPQLTADQLVKLATYIARHRGT